MLKTVCTLVFPLAMGVILSSCGDREGVIKPDQNQSAAPVKATQGGTAGSLAGTACTTVSECGPGLDCDLSRGPTKGVCVERVNPGSTPQPSQK